jgi:hypothetical protein
LGTTREQRTCRACGGSGYRDDDDFGGCGYDGYYGPELTRCPRCKGTGTETIEHVDRPLPKTSLQVPVVGVKAMDIDLSGITEATPVRLVAEPDNHVDPNAIKVVARTHESRDGAVERMVGYLPAPIAARMSADEWIAEIVEVLHFRGDPSGLRIKVHPKPVTIEADEPVPVSYGCTYTIHGERCTLDRGHGLPHIMEPIPKDADQEGVRDGRI